MQFYEYILRADDLWVCVCAWESNC